MNNYKLRSAFLELPRVNSEKLADQLDKYGLSLDHDMASKCFEIVDEAGDIFAWISFERIRELNEADRLDAMEMLCEKAIQKQTNR